MISKERLEILRFQIDHHGLTPAYYETLRKSNLLKPDLPHAPAIAITSWELRQLLDAYEPVADAAGS